MLVRDKGIHAIEQDSAIYYYLQADSALIADAAYFQLVGGHNIRLVQSNVMPFQLIAWNLEISLEYFFLKNDFNKSV